MNGRRLSYLAVDGHDGPAILLIHGSGVSARYWIEQMRGLGSTGRPLAIDLPGHGESEGIEYPSIEHYADVAAGALDALGVGPVIAAGHSLGGAVAVALAARHRSAVRGLVLLSTCARLPAVDGAGQWLVPFLPGPLRRALFFATAQNLLFAPSASGGAVSLGMRELRACHPETIARDVAIARSMNLTESARMLRVPTLILCGGRDRITPPALSRHLQGVITGSRLEIVDGAGHMLLIEAPDRVTDEIRRFAASLGPGATPGWRTAVGAVNAPSWLRSLLHRLRALVRGR